MIVIAPMDRIKLDFRLLFKLAEYGLNNDDDEDDDEEDG